MRELRLLIIAVLVVLITSPSAGAWGLEFALGGWYQDPKGTLGYKALGVDDILDLENDLKYEEETRVAGRLNIDMPLFIPNIYLMATPVEFEATGQKDGGFKFGDIVFDPGPFETKTVLDHLDVGLYYGIPLLETATLKKFNIDIAD